MSQSALFTSTGTKLLRALTNTESLNNYLNPILSATGMSERQADSWTATVHSIYWQNDDLFSLRLHINRKHYQHFRAGQYVQLEAEIDGQRLQRYFSIVSAPYELREQAVLELGIRCIEDGKVTPWLGHTLKPGSKLRLSKPAGEFCIQAGAQQHLFIAAGSGITPILSMLKALSAQGSADRCTLLYYHHYNESQIPFRKTLQSLEDFGVAIHLIDTRTQGHFCKAHLAPLRAELCEHNAYICGPGNMIESCFRTLESLGFSGENIHYEFFGANSFNRASDLESDSHSRVIFGHSKVVSDWNAGQALNILELAENAKVPAISGCRIGVCHQCVCTKAKGRVRNLQTGLVSDSGREEIQLCQSIPVDTVELEL